MRVGSLCSGYGGLDQALSAVTGAQVAWHFEYDKHPAAILEARFPSVPNYRDITTHDFTNLEPVDWLTAGYPCQPFSHAGKRQGAKDERHLWPDVFRAVGVLRPRRVFLENVAGHVSLGLDRVLWDLASIGYDATWSVVRASDAGAPHGRTRVFILAADTRGERHGGGQDCGCLGRLGRLGRLDGSDAGGTRQRERSRAVAVDRGSAALADTGSGPLAGTGATRNGLRIVAQRRAVTAANTEGDGRGEGWPESAGVVGGPDAPLRRDGDASHTNEPGPQGSEPARGLDLPAWGAYEPAIRRWENLTRPAPRPTEPGRNGERLSPAFVEWMMGLPAGWVTGVDIPRNAQLKALGNGVVPQQAALALRMLFAALAVPAAVEGLNPSPER